MADLSVDFLGFKFSNPLIVGSSPLTSTLDNIREICDKNAGALVLKSLFEEELRDNSFAATYDHPESYDMHYLDAHLHYGSKNYLKFVEDVKKISSVPTFASINCLEGKWWAQYGVDIENAGADAVEMNISYFSFSNKINSSDVERFYVDTVHKVKESINIPLLVKIGNWFPSLPNFVSKLEKAGADGVTLFNRYYNVSYDIETMDFTTLNPQSHSDEHASSFRWIGTISPQTNIDLCGSSGIHSAESVIKILLAGGKAAQITTILYQKGFEAIPEILRDINSWLDNKGYASASEIIGHITRNRVEDIKNFERTQYVKTIQNR